MALMQKDIDAAHFKGERLDDADGEEAAQKTCAATDAGTQDDHLWDCAIADNMDAIRDLADKALADRRAGRTKKITL